MARAGERSFLNRSRRAFSVSAGVMVDCAAHYTKAVFRIQDMMPEMAQVVAKLREEFAGLGKGLGFWLDFSRFQGGRG